MVLNFYLVAVLVTFVALRAGFFEGAQAKDLAMLQVVGFLRTQGRGIEQEYGG
jgi:hypothetical protein